MFPNASNGIRAAAASSDPLDFTDSSDLDDIGDLNSQDLLPLLERTPTPPPPLMSRHNPLQVDSMSVRTYSKNKVTPPLHRYIFPIDMQGLTHIFSVSRHNEAYQSMSSSKLAQNARNTMFRKHS